MDTALDSHNRAQAFSLRLTNAQYHAREELSNSGNNILIDESPMHFKYYKDNPPKRTPAMITGEIVHLLVLEPDLFLENAVVMPDCDRRTTAGKNFYEQFMIENSNKQILTSELYHQAFGMIGSIMEHPTARALLQNNHNELSFFTEIDGVKVRARPDILREGRIICDLKTTDDASFHGFQKTIARFHYARQAAFYSDVVASVTGERYDSFTFLACEKHPPYAVQVFTLDEASMDKGREEYRAGLAIYRKCLENNEWPGYSLEAVPMNLPSFAW